MGEQAKNQHLHELLESFDTGMLITRHGEQNHARPMAIACVDETNCIWFATSIDSPKAEEIRADTRVSVTLQTSRKFVALSGTARLVSDRAKIEELWKETWKVWFPKGKTDPAIALIRVDVDDAEFWDNAGAKGVRYVFEAMKGLISGQRPDLMAGQHGRVRGPEVQQPTSSRR